MRSRVGGWVVTDLGFESGDLLYADVASSAAATKVGGRPKTGKKKKKRKCLENFEFAQHEYGWYAHRWAIWSTPGSSLLNAATKIAGSALLP